MQKNVIMRTILSSFILLVSLTSMGQQTVFENSGGKETATYFETIAFYKTLAAKSVKVQIKEMGMSDAGYPLHLVIVSNKLIKDSAALHKNGRVVIMINNGIHPGEPDGIDASMMLVRNIVTGKLSLPENIVLGIIPIYNIGGALNRNNSTRVNQNGPVEYGFRGNAQNLDLNRDFTKMDSRNARSFAGIFHYLNPDILIDNHVSDGADYQHTMTLISTQYDKLGSIEGEWLRNNFEPALYVGMKEKNWDLIPYVEFDGANFDKGITQFYESPRYSSGYAALFGCLSFIPETHMLKPYKERVNSTYDLMRTFIEQASLQSKELLQVRKAAAIAVAKQQVFPLRWKPDMSKSTEILFKGYTQDSMISKATGLMQMYYDRNRPYERKINYFNFFKADNIVSKPRAYIIPAGWYEVAERMKLNGVVLTQIKKDTIVNATVYRIEHYKTRSMAYEKHYPHYATETSSFRDSVFVRKNDWIVYLNQSANRFIVEMLEPTGDDSFFSWNFFDAILQQKEGYSDYRWDAIAANVLENDPGLKKKLEEKKKADPVFAMDSRAVLNFVYRNSAYYEKAHMRYPVYRIE